MDNCKCFSRSTEMEPYDSLYEALASTGCEPNLKLLTLPSMEKMN